MRALILISIFFSSIYSDAQTLFTYGDHTVSRQEFLRAWNKNNEGRQATPKAYHDYLELYLRFKLKVQAALDKKMDTLPGQRAELQSFRSQLAEGFLVDDSTLEALVNEAFERSKKDIHIAHIFTPSDSTTHTDTSDAGFISVFTLPYTLEKIVYSISPGGSSEPYRGKDGGHIFRNIEERPARGSIKAAQILLLFPPDAQDSTKRMLKRKADSIYRALVKGASFEHMAKQYSNDNLTYLAGGEMPEFTPGKYDPLFENAVFGLKKDGDITPPVLTEMGYHIIKRIALAPVNTNKKNATAMAALRRQVLSDGRAAIARKAMVEKIYRIVPLSRESYNEDQAVNLYRDSLEKYNPEFAAQMQEFKEGNLLFEIMQATIWNKPAAAQSNLEEKWIAELKKKYPVKINEAILQHLL